MHSLYIELNHGGGHKMGRIDIGSHRITKNDENKVICPWIQGKAPKGFKQKCFLSTEASYMCAAHHLHKISDFPELTTNDIKTNQIHRRG